MKTESLIKKMRISLQFFFFLTYKKIINKNAKNKEFLKSKILVEMLDFSNKIKRVTSFLYNLFIDLKSVLIPLQKHSLDVYEKCLKKRNSKTHNFREKCMISHWK